MEVSCQLHHPGRFTPRETAPRYPLDGRLGWLQGRSRRYGEEEKSLLLPGVEPLSFIPDPSHYTDWTIPAPLFL
jgi:hypothetical protein